MQKHGLSLKQILEADSVDVLLDFAYAQKAKGNYEDAQLAFSMACDLYPSAEMSVLYAIETANIQKEIGKYDSAIFALQRGVVNALDENVKNDFLKNIKYLTIIRDILWKNGIASLPYKQIPAKIIEEIEFSFKKYQ